MPGADQIKDLLDLGIGVGLVVILVGGFREWWVYGPQHRRQLTEITTDRNFWRDMALANLRLAERATDAVPQVRRDAE